MEDYVGFLVWRKSVLAELFLWSGKIESEKIKIKRIRKYIYYKKIYNNNGGFYQ